MAKFGKYKMAEIQTGLGAFPDVPSNISQNTQPTMDSVSMSEGSRVNLKRQQSSASTGPKVLSSQEIYDILKKNKAL